MPGKLTTFFGLLAITILPAAAQPAATPAAAPTKDRHFFDILRDGSKIGSEIVEIDRQGDTINIQFTTHISVSVMFIQAYHFDHSATETWTGGRFVSFKSATDDNGTKHNVAALANADGIDLDVDGKHSEVAADFVPASWWCKDFVNRADMFDSDTGRQVSVKVTDLGDEPIVQDGTTIQARHYKITGDLERDLWFDGDTLVRIKLYGSDHSTIVSDLTR